MKQIRIALTGGPGGGKSEVIAALRTHYIRKGIHIVTVPETATDLILAGMDGRKTLSNRTFQGAQLDLQLYKENLFSRAAETIDASTVVIVCDRGTLDGLAFCDPKDFDALLKQRNLTKEQLLERYDAILHLASAARYDLGHYQRASNPARQENAREAIEEDDRLLAIYRTHPLRKIIAACDSPQAKTEAALRCLDELVLTLSKAE